jgi:predicted Rossmann fold flavoprotein
LAGISLSFIKITFYSENNKILKNKFSKTGKILFTHFGLSSPLILNSAKNIKNLLDYGKVCGSIDLYPDTNIGDLEKRIIKVFDLNKNKIFKTILKEIVQNGMSNSISSLINFMDLDIKVHSITKENRKDLVKLLKGLPFNIGGLMGDDRSVVSDGGVYVGEINMKTMQSKLIDNLYVTGDLLHLNRNSGGYSLQICWTTGYIAGISV